jgi:hypothetical protein
MWTLGKHSGNQNVSSSATWETSEFCIKIVYVSSLWYLEQDSDYFPTDIISGNLLLVEIKITAIPGQVLKDPEVWGFQNSWTITTRRWQRFQLYESASFTPRRYPVIYFC